MWRAMDRIHPIGFSRNANHSTLGHESVSSPVPVSGQQTKNYRINSFEFVIMQEYCLLMAIRTDKWCFAKRIGYSSEG